MSWGSDPVVDVHIIEQNAVDWQYSSEFSSGCAYLPSNLIDQELLGIADSGHITGVDSTHLAPE